VFLSVEFGVLSEPAQFIETRIANRIKKKESFIKKE
jgi:hypothetical protein